VLQRALLPAVGRKIDVGDLPDTLRGARSAEHEAGPAGPLTLADVEREHVERVLLHCRWNRSEAAGMLGSDRRTLFNKIRRYGLVGPLTLRGAEAADEMDVEEQ
jgi:transcriptional regulator of acetoin/glycerol metabolism